MLEIAQRSSIYLPNKHETLGLFSELKKKRNYQKRLGMFRRYDCRIWGKGGGEDLGGMGKGKLLKLIV